MSLVDDDIFDESVGEEAIGARDWQKIESDLQKDGYRHGLTAGQESQLQNSFNKGFQESSNFLFDIARLRGEICATLTFNKLSKDPTDASQEDKLQVLLEEVGTFEHKCIKMEAEQIKHLCSSDYKNNLKDVNLPIPSKCSQVNCCKNSNVTSEARNLCKCNSEQNDTACASVQREISEEFYNKEINDSIKEIQNFKTKFKTIMAEKE